MDNLTHSLVGAVIGQTGLKRKTRKAMAALVLGANGPDIDVFFGWVGWLPLATHRGFTHGVIGSLIVMPLMIAGFLWGLDRWQSGRGETFEGKPELDWRWLLGLALIGCVTHPLLDLQTTYAVQLLSPFSTDWFHADSLFIIDLVLLLLLGGSFWWSRRREKRGGNWPQPARAALAVMLVYIGTNLWATERAKGVLTAKLGFEADRIVAGPPPLAFWRRDLSWRSGDRYGWGRYDPFAPTVFEADRLGLPSRMDDPLVRKAIAASPEVQRFLRWSIMPFATIKREPCEAAVIFKDARYSNAISRTNFEHIVRVPTCR